MADVEVYDAAYVEALEASVVVGGHINETGHLVLQRGNGEEFNAGVVSLNVPWEDVIPNFFGTLTVGNGTLKCRAEIVNKTANLIFTLICGTTTTGPADTPLELEVSDYLPKDAMAASIGFYQDQGTIKSAPMLWKLAQREVKKYNSVTDSFEIFYASSLGQFDILSFSATFELN